MKKLLAIVALGALVATGAFAELTFGVSAIQYFEENENGDYPSLGDAFEGLQEGDGVYWGGFGEIIGKHFGLGLAFNYDPMQSSEGQPSDWDLYSYDVNLYLSYHLFGGGAFLDPFAEVGFGMFAYDYLYKDKLNATEYAAWIDDDDPLMASAYTNFALGLGVNLKPFGVFFKARWIFPMDDTVTGTRDKDYPIAEEVGQEYFIDPITLFPFNWVLGAKILLF